MPQPSSADPSDATFLQNNILISSTPIGPVVTRSSGGTALKNYLTAQYAGGAGVGKYVFLRLSTDSASTSARRYTVAAADSASAGPQIIYNLPSGYTRPFIWVREVEKASIQHKIANNAWATSVFNGMISRLADGSASSTMVIAGTLAGPDKSLQKEGNGLTLSLAGANTYSGETRILGGILSLDHRLALQNSVLDTLNSVAGSATNGLRTTVTTLTLGGLTGDKNLASVFTTPSGGYSGVTALTLNPESGAAFTYSGGIANGAAGMTLTKTGSGTQILSGTNTYTGTTTISANSGTLEIGGAGKLGNGSYAGAIAIGSGSLFRYAGTTTINGGTLQGVVGGNCANSSVTLNHALATYGVSITNNTQTWTCAAFTSSAAGKLEFDFGSILPGPVKPLTVTGLANFLTSPTVRVIVSTGLAPGTYPLMAWGSTSGTVPTVVTVLKPNGTGGLADGTAASLAVAGNTLKLVITGVPGFIKANNSNNLNLGTSWVGGVAPDATATAQWGPTVTAANTTVLGADLTWSGIFIGNPGGTVTLNAGNTLTLGANANDIEMSAAGANLIMNCPLVLGDANVWNVGTGRTLTIGGVVSGAFPVTKEGAGTATLSGTNTYTGDTTISATSGTLEISGAGKLGNGDYAGAIDIGSGSIFRFSGSAAQTLGGSISGAGTIIKDTGTNPLTLSGSNDSFAGPVSVAAGTLELGHANALGDASALSLAGGATLATQVTGLSTSTPITLGTAATNSTISFSRNAAATGAITLNGLISGDANLIFTTPNVVSGGHLQTVVLGSANTYAGTTTLTTGNSNNSTAIKAGTANSLPATTVLTLNGGNGAGTGRSVRFDLNGFNQTLAGLTNITGLTSRSQKVLNTSSEPATLTINNSSNYTFSGNLDGAALDLIKVGAGTQTLSGSNTHAGSTTIRAGILSLGHSLALQNSALETLDSIAGNATNGLRTTVTTLTLGGLSGDKNLAAVFTTTTGGYSGLTALTVNPGTGTTLDYSGVIADGASGMTLTKTGLGTQILSGANTYTGLTDVTEGTLKLAGNRPSANVMAGLNVGGSTSPVLHIAGDVRIGGASLGLWVGHNSGTGSVNQTAGAVSFTLGDLLLVGSQAAGTYHLSGGSIVTTQSSATRGLMLGVNAGINGTFNLSGGVLDLATHAALLMVGRSDTAANNSTVIYQQTGGTATVGTLTIGGAASGSAGVNASFSVTGGSFAADHFTLLAAGSANTATMTIGGTAEVMLPAFPIGRGPDSTATLYFDGGILKPLAADTAYLGGLTHAFIKTGGATFDTTYGSITISQALLTDAVATGGGLTKNGSNTVTLIGANTYSGDTTVNGGTLSQGTINIDNELSTITLAASDALLQLNFTGTDTVTKLFIGTAQQPAGQYGHSSTGATNGGLGVAAMDAFFAPGPGTLTVTGSPPLDGYAAWKTDHAPVGGANDDFDTDGVPNGIEYVLGGTKDTADGDKLPTLSASGGNIVFAFVRDQASIDGSTTRVIEVGTTPGLWADSHPVPDGPAAANPGVTVAKDHPAAGRDTVMLSLPMDEATRRFARLKVTVR